MRGAVRRIVSNTGPLISLEKLNQGHDFIRCLYQKLIIPPAVLDEVAEGKFADPQEYLQYYCRVRIEVRNPCEADALHIPNWQIRADPRRSDKRLEWTADRCDLHVERMRLG